MVKDIGKCALVFVLLSLLATPGVQALTIDIIPNDVLAANTAALSAIERAASAWESYFSDPITVTISMNLANMGSTTIIGSTSMVALVGDYDLIRNAMAADADADDGIAAYLPTADEFSAVVPVGFSLADQIQGTKANFKALGFENLDSLFGVLDATITFNSLFAFDFDQSDGVSSGTMDLETVAMHEIAHALGFVSIVDSVDVAVENGQTGVIAATPLDLYRFEDGTANDPATTGDFTNDPRNLTPGNAAIFDDLDDEYAMATGRYNGDGNQASHWKNDDITSILIGIMDPTLAYGQIIDISEADLRALDLIGYDIVLMNTPLPTSILLLGAGLACLAIMRRRGGTLASPSA